MFKAMTTRSVGSRMAGNIEHATYPDPTKPNEHDFLITRTGIIRDIVDEEGTDLAHLLEGYRKSAELGDTDAGNLATALEKYIESNRQILTS